jgi:hypothetical protein
MNIPNNIIITLQNGDMLIYDFKCKKRGKGNICKIIHKIEIDKSIKNHEKMKKNNENNEKMKKKDEKYSDNGDEISVFPTSIFPLIGNYIATTHECIFAIYEVVPSLFSIVPTVKNPIDQVT